MASEAFHVIRGIGTYLMPASPLDFGATPRLEPMRAPLLGEHTDEILTSVPWQIAKGV